MSTDSATTRGIDYLQRSGAGPEIIGHPRTEGPSRSRRLLRVMGVGRPETDQLAPIAKTDRWRPATAELITGLYGYRIPLAFWILGSTTGVRIHLGTWSAREAAAQVQDRRIGVIQSVLRGLYPVVELDPVSEQLQGWSLGGLALGIPAPAGIDPRDGAAPIDRIMRSMTGADWSVVVLAYPVAEDAVSRGRDSLLNEMRGVQSAAQNELAPSPLTEQYVDLMKASLAQTAEEMATGAWRTGVYLLGNDDSYPRLASAWRSVMSGEMSLPEPVRVFDRPEVGELAQAWALPDQEGAGGPGHYQRPFECQTLLSTPQLAAYVHLPELEAPGFKVSLVSRFDVVTTAASAADVEVVIGEVLHNRQATAGTYSVPLRSLTRHVFVAGVTGSGKTNTLMSLLVEANSHGIPFLVLEPTKTEYRALIDHTVLGAETRVFTAGKATVSPFVLNPFEVPAGTTVSEHLDLLRATFTAAFGMWTPLPQILERCLHDIYIDRGWDLRTNGNFRLPNGAETTAAFPTLSDLIAKTEEVIPSLGYEEKVAGDLKAALVTRLESLRQGAKGAALDVARSLPPEELFDHPTVVELDAIGDAGDKAFFTGLLLTRLAEHRRTQGQSPELVHLLVIEEAHRLLTNVSMVASEEVANPRGEAVETFSNLLSEIRAYGQGVVIADQIPVRLAPDAMKNTNLKISHRIVSTDDREALAGAMAMDRHQTKALTSLELGEAAVSSGGDDAPLLVRIPLVKDPLGKPPPDSRVNEHMLKWRTARELEPLFQAQAFCSETCATVMACEAARRILDDEFVRRTLSRTVLSTIDELGALDRLWGDLAAVVRARRPATVPDDDLFPAFAGHASDWLASHRGAQAVWSYADTAEFRDRLREVLLAKARGGEVQIALLASLQQVAHRLHARRFEPYPACQVVCTQDPPLCLYRSAVADLVTSGRYRPAWRDADEVDAGSEDNRRRQTWEVCQDAAYELVEFPDEDQPTEVREAVELAARQVCLCFEQQMLAEDRRKVPRTSRRILARVLSEAGL
jgi:hypothetical protein